jgi:hypothetical protein
MPGRAVIARQQRLFDDFFKIDELLVTHRQVDGTMSSVQRRLIFERGDSVAVLLFNRDYWWSSSRRRRWLLVGATTPPPQTAGSSKHWRE